MALRPGVGCSAKSSAPPPRRASVAGAASERCQLGARALARPGNAGGGHRGNESWRRSALVRAAMAGMPVSFPQRIARPSHQATLRLKSSSSCRHHHSRTTCATVDGASQRRQSLAIEATRNCCAAIGVAPHSIAPGRSWALPSARRGLMLSRARRFVYPPPSARASSFLRLPNAVMVSARCHVGACLQNFLHDIGNFSSPSALINRGKPQ